MQFTSKIDQTIKVTNYRHKNGIHTGCHPALPWCLRNQILHNSGHENHWPHRERVVEYTLALANEKFSQLKSRLACIARIHLHQAGLNRM